MLMFLFLWMCVNKLNYKNIFICNVIRTSFTTYYNYNTSTENSHLQSNSVVLFNKQKPVNWQEIQAEG
jgi:hypothetical protein